MDVRALVALVALGSLAAPAHAATKPDADVRARLKALFQDPDALGPPVTVRRLDLSETACTIGLELPLSVDAKNLPPSIENRFESAVGLLAAERPAVASIHLLVAHPGQPLAPPPRAPKLPSRARTPRKNVRPDPVRFPYGQALVGRTVAISPGHGYIFYDSLGRYSTQRGNLKWEGCGACDGIIEDFGSHQLAVRHLVPLLEGAGARVVLLRERDIQRAGQIVDESEAVERAGVFDVGNNPGGHDGDYRVSNDPAAEIEYAFSAPVNGRQVLSLWFVPGANRVVQGRIEVDAGGDLHPFVVDMTSHGRRWTPITTMDLWAGQPVTVRMRAPSAADASQFLIADAVRLGSGTHSSGHAWWSMGAQPFAVHQAAPESVTGFSDVSIRPRYAEFFGADAYLSLHSNASGADRSTAAGTSSYRYNCGRFPDHSNDPPAGDCDDPTGSDRLQALVHAEMVASLRADWDPNWRDRGPKVANFGEVRNLDGIPGVLMESAFHDNVRLPEGSTLRMTDNQAMHYAQWRRAAAWGLYRGLSQFLAPEAPFVPAAPTLLAVRRVDATTLEVDATPVAEAEGYRIRVAVDGPTFDDGRLVDTLPARVEGLPEDAVVGVRVSALNAAGEGPPSRVLAARPANRRAQVLIVDAYDREDAWVQEWDNPGDTALVHGLALRGVEHAFDSADEAALGSLDLSAYDAIVVALGRESTRDEILTPALRAELAGLAPSAALFFGGTEIGWALDARGDDAGRAFLDDVFGAAYAADDAESAGLSAASGGWLAALGPLTLADAETGLVETQYPDAFALGTDGVAELTYAGGSQIGAVRRGDDLLLGVGLENVVGAEARAELLGTWLSRAVDLAPADVVPGDAGVPAPDAGPLDSGFTPDAGTPDAGRPDAAVRLRPTHPQPIRGGSGCGTTATAGSTLLLWLGLGAFLIYRRRSDM